MSQPAARVTDMHTCPMVTGLVPHVGGPILPPGCPTVLVGGVPDARIGDLSTCVGPPDPIARGAATVLIGGLPPSRITDITSHGGVIITGMPTVLIGEPVVTMKIDGDAQFARDLQAAWTRILPTPSGIGWLQKMGKNGQTVTFRRTNDDNGYCTSDDATKAGNGVGTGSTVEWNPNHHTVDAGLPGAQGTPGSHVILAHEMIHALHNANGDERNGPFDSFPGQDGSSARNEERSTVGTAGPVQQPDGTNQVNPPDYSHDAPTENSFRDDLGIPRRPSYYPSNWPGGAPW